MVVIIAGPTGVGKTKMAVELAKHYNTEIISGDSMQIYKGLDIGTAKVTTSEAQGITHHMIDIIEPTKDYSVAQYQRQVRHLINTFQTKNKRPIIAGGTGYYIKSVLHDFDFSEAHQSTTFEQQFESTNNEALHSYLASLDKASSETMHPNNRKRVLQALYRVMHGKKKSALKEPAPLYDYCLIVLSMDRKTLYERIDQRVDQMMAEGLVEEAKMLYDSTPSTTASKAIGYKELFGYFEGDYDLKEAIRLIKRNTRRYAKRQFTYFNNQFNPHYIDMGKNSFENAFYQAVKIIDKT